MKSFKVFGAVAAVSVMAISASAQMWPLMEGTQEIQVSGSLEWDRSDGDRTELQLGYGYFIEEGVEVGPRLRMVDENNDAMYSLDAYLEYHYPLADNVAPYAGLSLGYFNNNKADDSSALGATISFGCKFFMVEDMALDISFNHTQATGDVFSKNYDYDSHRSNISMGLRFFY